MEITFSDLKTKIDVLLKQTSEEKIIPILQDIMHTLLSGYVFKKNIDKLESQKMLIKEEKPDAKFYLSSRININSNKKDAFLRMVRIEDNYFTGLKEINKLKNGLFPLINHTK